MLTLSASKAATCKDTSITYTATVENANPSSFSYAWTVDGVSVGSGATYTHTFTATGSFKVKCVATSVAVTVADSISGTVGTVPTISCSVNLGNSADFGKVTITSTTASSAAWYNSNNDSVGNWLSGMTPVLPVDTYTVSMTNYCGVTTASVIVEFSPVCTADGINNNEGTYSFAGTDYVQALTDINGNNYSVVQIGTQCWLKENLRTTKFADGTDLVLMSNTASLSGNDFEYMEVLDVDGNAPAFCGPYNCGYLYNWKAATKDIVSSGQVQGVCPDGWHLPKQTDVTALHTYIDQWYYSGKATAIDGTYWTAYNVGFGQPGNTSDQSESKGWRNITGFSAVPSGSRQSSYIGDRYLGTQFRMWTSTEGSDSIHAKIGYLVYNLPDLNSQDMHINQAAAVRCLRNTNAFLSMQSDQPKRVAAGTPITYTATIINPDTAADYSFSWSVDGVVMRAVSDSYTCTFYDNDEHIVICNVSVTYHETPEPDAPEALTDNATVISYVLAEVATNSVLTVGVNAASIEGEVIEAGDPVIAECGICYNTTGTPVVTDSKVAAASVAVGTYTVSLTGLTSGETYYARAYGINSDDTVYGAVVTFTTIGVSISADQEDSFTACDSAKVTYTASVATSGDPADITLQWYVNDTLQVGETGTSFITSTTKDSSFTVKVVASKNAENVFAVKNMNITVKTLPTLSCSFRWGNSANFGVYAIDSTTANSLVWYYESDSVGNWMSGNTPVLPVGTYNVAATNGCGTNTYTYTVSASPICYAAAVNGNEGSYAFAGNDYVNSITDIDGNEYPVVQIGSQCWIKENLRTTKYADGTSIEFLDNASNFNMNTSDPTGSNAANYAPVLNIDGTAPDFCSTYNCGYWYNWRAATNNTVSAGQIQGVCPDGWHLPSKDEGTALGTYGSSIFGINALPLVVNSTYNSGASGTSPGGSANLSYSNALGFSGLATGYRWYANDDRKFGNDLWFWTSTDYNSYNAYACDLARGYGNLVTQAAAKYYGMSVRCMRDTNASLSFSYPQACPGSQETVTAAIINGNVGDYTFQWELDGVVDGGQTGNTFTFTPASFGEYAVSCTATKGAQTISKSVAVNIPAATMNVTVNKGNSNDFGTVTINGTTATSAEWKDSDNNTVGTWLSGNTSVLPVGTYSIVLTGACGASTQTVEIVYSPVCVAATVNGNEGTPYELGGVNYVQSVEDYDGNSYNVVQIGSQCWTRENMRCTHSPSTGSSIFSATSKSNNVSKVALWYSNNAANADKNYGLLYNWCAAMDTFKNTSTSIPEVATGNANATATWTPTFPAGYRQGICPTGWHVTTLDEWDTMIVFANDAAYDLAAAKLPDGSTDAWYYKYVGAVKTYLTTTLDNLNKTGLSIIPAGSMNQNAGFSGSTQTAWFYTSTYNSGTISKVKLEYNASTITRSTSTERRYCHSVRCIRD